MNHFAIDLMKLHKERIHRMFPKSEGAPPMMIGMKGGKVQCIAIPTEEDSVTWACAAFVAMRRFMNSDQAIMITDGYSLVVDKSREDEVKQRLTNLREEFKSGNKEVSEAMVMYGCDSKKNCTFFPLPYEISGRSITWNPFHIDPQSVNPSGPLETLASLVDVESIIDIKNNKDLQDIFNRHGKTMDDKQHLATLESMAFKTALQVLAAGKCFVAAFATPIDPAEEKFKKDIEDFYVGLERHSRGEMVTSFDKESGRATIVIGDEHKPYAPPMKGFCPPFYS